MEGKNGFFHSSIKTDASHAERLHWARRRSQCTTVLHLQRIKTSSLSRSTTERTCLVSQRHRIFPPQPTILASSIKSSRSLGCKTISHSSGETKVRSRSWYVFHREIRMPSYEADGYALQGQSAGAMSISLAITRRNSSVVPPFRAAILLSGEKVSAAPQPNFKNFDAFATAMGCSQSLGPQRLDCLRTVPASTIHNFTTVNPFVVFSPQVDK